MSSITIEEAQARLPALIAGLKPGEIMVITQQERPVAQLVGGVTSPPGPRRPGSARGKLLVICEDDEHLRDFQEYMP